MKKLRLPPCCYARLPAYAAPQNTKKEQPEHASALRQSISSGSRRLPPTQTAAPDSLWDSFAWFQISRRTSGHDASMTSSHCGAGERLGVSSGATQLRVKKSALKTFTATGRESDPALQDPGRTCQSRRSDDFRGQGPTSSTRTLTTTDRRASRSFSGTATWSEGSKECFGINPKITQVITGVV